MKLCYNFSLIFKSEDILLKFYVKVFCIFLMFKLMNKISMSDLIITRISTLVLLSKRILWIILTDSSLKCTYQNFRKYQKVMSKLQTSFQFQAFWQKTERNIRTYIQCVYFIFLINSVLRYFRPTSFLLYVLNAPHRLRPL